MKSGFSKELVERERINSDVKFKRVRKSRKMKSVDATLGTHERMRVRHQVTSFQRYLNENLNPLKNYLRTSVGRKWDAVYSELCKEFDARNVVNRHIFEHIFDYVLVNTFLGEDGEPMTHTLGSSEPMSVFNSYRMFYVCPKTGILKSTARKVRKSVLGDKAAKQRLEELDKERDLGDKMLKRCDDGIWYIFDKMYLSPVNEILYRPPHGIKTFDTVDGEKTWDELLPHQKRFFGVRVGESAVDEFDKRTVWASFKPALYLKNKRTASKAVLKANGLLGTARVK